MVEETTNDGPLVCIIFVYILFCFIKSSTRDDRLPQLHLCPANIIWHTSTALAVGGVWKTFLWSGKRFLGIWPEKIWIWTRSAGSSLARHRFPANRRWAIEEGVVTMVTCCSHPCSCFTSSVLDYTLLVVVIDICELLSLNIVIYLEFPLDAFFKVSNVFTLLMCYNLTNSLT